MKISELVRIDRKLNEEIKKMQKERLEKGKDNQLKPITPRRITLAMTRHPLFQKIKKDIISADLK